MDFLKSFLVFLFLSPYAGMLPCDPCLALAPSLTSFRFLPKSPPQRGFLSSLCLKYHSFFTLYSFTWVCFFLHFSFTTYNYIYFIIVSLLHHNVGQGPCLFDPLNRAELVHCLAHDRYSINSFERMNK